jgi:DNA-binding Lrp family transcriptional regulator
MDCRVKPDNDTFQLVTEARIARSEIRDRRSRMSLSLMRARRRERRPLPPAAVFAGLPLPAEGRTEARMVPFFVQIKCQLGQSYDVANKLADAELASEIYSTAGDFDLLVKFYVEDKTDIGHFVNEKVQTIPGVQDTRTIITFKAF